MKKLLFSLLFFVTIPLLAAPGTDGYQWRRDNKFYDSVNAACGAVSATHPYQKQCGENMWKCTTTPDSCSGWTVDRMTTCITGYVWDGSTCVPASTTTTTTTSTTSSSTTSTLPPCPAGEAYRLGVCMPKPCPDGEHLIPVLTVTPTGTYFPLKCMPAGEPSPTPEPTECPGGGAPVNGGCAVPQMPNPCPPGYMQISSDPNNPICTMKPKTDTEVSEETKPDGTKVKTEKNTTTNKNPDGSTSKNTTTTITTTSPTGEKTVVVSHSSSRNESGSGDDGEGSDFCAENPELSICKVSSANGTCGAIACDGDAIQCEIMKKSAEAACREKEISDAIKDSSARTLGDTLLAGDDPLSGTLPSPANGLSLSVPGSLNQSGFLGGAACFPDKSFSLGDFTVVIPFSEVCQYLIAFRGLVMLLAAFTSFRIFSSVIFK